MEPRTRDSAWLDKKDNGEKTVKQWTCANSKFYEDKVHGLVLADHTFVDRSESKVGNISLRHKIVSSVGIRRDNNPFKYVGFRPDYNQDGGEQLEFTIEEINFNNTNVPIDLSKNEEISNETICLGYIYIHQRKFSTEQAVRADVELKDFYIRYTIHAKGLFLENKLKDGYYDSGSRDTFVFNDYLGNLRYTIRRPKILDKDFKFINNDTVHSLRSNGDGTYEYIKRPSHNLINSSILSSARYIDADTLYTTANSDQGILSRWLQSPTFNATNFGTMRTTLSTVYPHYADLYTNSNGNYGNDCVEAGYYYTSGFYIYRALFRFDTSSYNSGLTISAATFYARLTERINYSATGIACVTANVDMDGLAMAATDAWWDKMFPTTKHDSSKMGNLWDWLSWSLATGVSPSWFRDDAWTGIALIDHEDAVNTYNYTDGGTRIGFGTYESNHDPYLVITYSGGTPDPAKGGHPAITVRL